MQLNILIEEEVNQHFLCATYTTYRYGSRLTLCDIVH